MIQFLESIRISLLLLVIILYVQAETDGLLKLLPIKDVHYYFQNFFSTYNELLENAVFEDKI